MDQRASARVSVRLPALCRSDGVVIDGFVEDVSRTGLFLRTPKLVEAGSPAELELEVPGGPPLCLAAEVVRVEHRPERAGMGLRIIAGAASSRRLANFILRQHATLR